MDIRARALAGYTTALRACPPTVNPSRRTLLAHACLAPLAALPFAARAQSGHQVVPWRADLAVPPLAATDLAGKPWRLADLKGRAVLLNFWASWCEPCRAEMPTLQQLAELYGPRELAVLAINFKQSVATATRFVKSTSLTLPVILDQDGAIARQWDVSIFPTTVLIGADGRPRGRVRGELDWTGREAERLVAPLLTG